MVYTEVGDDVVLTVSGGYDNLNGLTLGEAGGYVGSDANLLTYHSGVYAYSGSSSAINQVFPVSNYTVNRINDSVLTVGLSGGGHTVADTSEIVGTVTFYSHLGTGGSINGLNLAYDNANDTPYTSVAYSGTATWNDTTFADLGMVAGSAEMRWDSGNQGINFTVVPEPSPYTGLAGLFVIAWVATRRNRKASV